MKDKQKRKKERTWAEAARLVRRAAKGGLRGGRGGVGSPCIPHREGEGEGRSPAYRWRGGATLPPGTGQPPKALGGERSPARLDVAPFSARHPHL